MNAEIRKVVPDLAWGAGIVVLALAASFARNQGLIDQDTVMRIVIGATGLMIASFGNRAPKLIAPGACARRLSRFAGWSLVLSGLAYAALWAFAPIQTAITGGVAVIALGVVATFAYGFRLRSELRG